jgi:hypothetical protein
MYLSNEINNVPTVCSPRHVNIGDVYLTPYDHSNYPIPGSAVRVRTIPVVVRGVVV